ncbi:MAG: glycosyltransferase family 9 protein [Cytophagaceae bacterium]
MKKTIKNILLIQTAFLGDVVLATPLIEKLHYNFPDAEIDFILKKGNESVLVNHPYIRNLIVFDKKQKVKSLIAIIKKIRHEKYDLAVNMHRFGSSGIFMLLSGAKTKTGFDKNPFSFCYNHKVKHVIGEDGEHETKRNLKLIEPFTDNSFFPPRIYPTAFDLEKIEKYKETRYITIAPASVWFTKQFPAGKWVELLDFLSNDNIKIFLIGGPGDFSLCEEIKNSSSNNNVSNLAGKLSLLQSAALIKDAELNYVNDSGPLHLASATNAPVCSVFCSTVPEFGFGPLSEFSRVIQTEEKLHCKPCNLHGFKECPEGHFKCANNISAKRLYEVYQEIKATHLAT